MQTPPELSPSFWYPNALWDKLTGDDPVPNGSDISASFNSNSAVNWYFGLDANPGPGQIDFVSVVLHELAHGLGFIGGQSQENPIEFSIRIQSGGSNPVFYPLIFSNSIVLGDGDNPDSILSLDDPSFDLREALTGGDLFNDAPAAISGITVHVRKCTHRQLTLRVLRTAIGPKAIFFREISIP